MRFGLLGTLAVWADDGRLAEVPEAKVRALLADLLIHLGQPVPADRLIDDLWGDDLPVHPAGALQVKVSRLRRALENAEPGGGDLVAFRSPGYLLQAGSDGTASGFEMGIVRPGGGFTLAGVAPGDYTMGVRAFFDEAETMRIASSGMLDGAPAFSMPLSVSGEPIEDLRIVVPPPVDVSGRVVFEGGTPAGAVFGGVSASNTLGVMNLDVRSPVGPDGRFTLRLRPGLWRFSAWTPPGWMIKRLTFRGTVVDEDGAVEVTSEGGRLEVLLTSQLTAVTGTVSDASGAPVLDYHAIVFPAERQDPSRGLHHRTRLDTSDEQGRFRLEGLPPGDYLVAAVVDVDAGEAVSDDTVDSVRESATPVRVREGQTETVALKLPPLP